MILPVLIIGMGLGVIFLSIRDKSPDTSKENLDPVGGVEAVDEELQKNREAGDPPSEGLREELGIQRNQIAYFQEYFRVLERVRRALLSMVINKTEASILSVTENVFRIAEESQKNLQSMASTLSPIIDTEGGIANNIRYIQEGVEDIDNITNRFKHLSHRIGQDKKSVHDAVSGINKFSAEITDMADQTNLLAINASIEAARVGNSGKGFGVIANNVQELSKRSKVMAEKITAVISEINTTVAHNFQILEEELRDTNSLLGEGKDRLGQTTENLAPQLELLKSSYGENEKVLQNLTKSISQITVDLQFQDMVRQILEHVQHLDGHPEGGSMPPVSSDQEERSNQIRETIIALAEECFTMDEEWESLSFYNYKPHKTSKGNKDFSGEVELF